MKRKNMAIAALILAAALVLSACGGASGHTAGDMANALPDRTDGAPDRQPAAMNSAGTAGLAPRAETMDAGAAIPSASSLAASSAGFADVFSNRDLSGTWDESAAVLIALNGSSISCDSGAVTVSGATATVSAAGTYRVTGTLDNGSLIVDAGQEDKVQIVLDNASIHADTFAALYVKQADKVFLTLADGTANTLSNGGTFETLDENNVDGAIFSKDDLTLNGSGKLIVNSPAKHGVVSKDDLIVTGGTYEITAASHALSAKDGIAVADGVITISAGKDGIHAENDEDSEKGGVYLAGGTITIHADDDGVTASSLLQIDGGALEIAASEGLEGNCIRINGGTIRVQASDDGINAARKSTGAAAPWIEINGGDIAVTVGPGDTDGVDVNGNLTITGGTISVTGNSTFDVDGTIAFTGGTVIVNGQQAETIPNQMMGGRGGFGAPNGGNFSVPNGGNSSGNGALIGRGGRNFTSPDAGNPNGNDGFMGNPNRNRDFRGGPGGKGGFSAPDGGNSSGNFSVPDGGNSKGTGGQNFDGAAKNEPAQGKGAKRQKPRNMTPDAPASMPDAAASAAIFGTKI